MNAWAVQAGRVGGLRPRADAAAGDARPALAYSRGMPMGEDGRWRPGTREDQRREAAARGRDISGRILRWRSPVVAALYWGIFLVQWSRGDDWRAGKLTDDEILARLFTLNQSRAATQGAR